MSEVSDAAPGRRGGKPDARLRLLEPSAGNRCPYRPNPSCSRPCSARIVYDGRTVQIRFWGTRGSIAAPGRKTARYGGNTSCVELRAPDGTLIVLDCGTGARELGLHLTRMANGPVRLYLFIGHTHWDH